MDRGFDRQNMTTGGPWTALSNAMMRRTGDNPRRIHDTFEAPAPSIDQHGTDTATHSTRRDMSLDVVFWSVMRPGGLIYWT
jgi:hypothetical protein